MPAPSGATLNQRAKGTETLAFANGTTGDVHERINNCYYWQPAKTH